MAAFLSWLALSALVADTSQRPSWQTDYGEAQVQSVRQNRPLAVFLAPGAVAWNKVVHDGNLSEDIQRLVAGKYVGVYVNTDTDQGRKLAAAFELPRGLGLVLSDRRGQNQAFWHDGPLTESQLARALERYGDVNGPIPATETNLTNRTSFYSPSSTVPLAPGGAASTLWQPVYSSQPMYFSGCVG
jgi:hypothetical protein